MPANIVIGISGSRLTSDEASLLREIQPFGVILFARNLLNRAQIQALTDSIQATSIGHPVLIFIDQEGGSVTRLPTPEFRLPPGGPDFARMFRSDPDVAVKACRLNHQLIALELRELGINVNCAPMLDLPQKNTDGIITRRAFGDTTEQIVALADAAIDGLHSARVESVLKHAPGHGRATSDSHKTLPVVNADIHSLVSSDFVPFRQLRHKSHFAMTAHLVFSQLDPNAAATQSEYMIKHIVREAIGFTGLVITDDIDMHALSGSIREKALKSWQAGCDLVLQCDGDFLKLKQLAEVASELSGPALDVARDVHSSVTQQPDYSLTIALYEEVKSLMG